MGAMLTDCDLLDFEATHPGHGPGKSDAIHALGLSDARYYQRLHRYAGKLEAQAHDPVTAHRVLRMLRGVREMGIGYTSGYTKGDSVPRVPLC